MLKLAERKARGGESTCLRADSRLERPIRPHGAIRVVSIPPPGVAPRAENPGLFPTSQGVPGSEIPQQDGSEPPKDEIAAELQCLLESRTFAKAFRQRELLNWIVRRWLEGRTDELDCNAIAVAVFRRDGSFDSGIDPIVRVEASRLRRQLQKYYSDEGAKRALRIDLPNGSYIPRAFRQPLQRKPTANASASEPGTLIILPFDNNTGNDLDSPTHRCVYDHLIWLLTQAQSVRVLSRITALHLAPALDPLRLRTDFGVSFIVEGAAVQDADGSYLMLHMTETAAGYNVWSGHYPLANTSIVSLSQRIVADLLSQMREVSGGG